MQRRCLKLLLTILSLSMPVGVQAQAIELQAISDFTNRESGAVPYYLEIAGGRNALAINAANPDYRNKFARAEHEFLGPDGIYDITIHALGEIDGDGTYRLLVNGIVQGEAVNSPVTIDYTVIEHTFEGIALTAPVVIAVESMAVSNNRIPEGDGFAFARGRWQALTLETHQTNPIIVESVDLGIALSTVNTLAHEGNTAPIVASVINHSELTSATNGQIEFVLPDGIEFQSSAHCVVAIDVVRCVLPEVSPGAVVTSQFNANITASGWLSLSASVNSDQADSHRQNNVASLAFEADAAPTATVDITPENQPTVNNSNTLGSNTPTDATTSTTTNEPNAVTTTDGDPMNAGMSTNSMATQDDTVSGSLGVFGVLALCLAGLSRTSRRRALRS